MATYDAKLDSGGTPESGMGQGGGTTEEDNVTRKGENLDDFNAYTMSKCDSIFASEVDPLSGTIMIGRDQETSGNENSQSIVDSDPIELDNGQEGPLCNPGDSGTLSETGGSKDNPSLDYVIIDEPRSGQKDCSRNIKIEESYLCDEEKKLADSPYVSDSSSLLSHETTIEHLDKADENILQSKLLPLNLSKENIDFLLEQGDKFLEKPPLLLARKLNIHVDKAKASIEALKCLKSANKTNNISEADRILIEDSLKENPEFSTPDDIALLIDIPIEVVTLYLQIRPLDEKQKADIKERVDTGMSIKDISVNLGISLMKVQEYVEGSFLTFTCEEGMRCLQIIQKTLEVNSSTSN